MGHGHSSSHKRLKSVSTSRAFECTEVVDFEFSDVLTCSEPVQKAPENEVRISKNIQTTTPMKNTNQESTIEASTKTRQAQEAGVIIEQSQYPKDLLVIIEHLKEIENSITNMSHDDFFVYFPTLKDDLHNCWQKVYSISEINLQTKQKKIDVINNIRSLLRKINSRL